MWSVQRKKRAAGWYYEAVRKSPSGRRCVSLKYLEAEPSPKDISKALRAAQEFAGDRELTDEEVMHVAEGGEPVRNHQIAKMLAGKFTSADAMGLSRGPDLPVKVEDNFTVGTALNKYGEMSLQEFHDRIWWPERATQVAASTVIREGKLWLAILDVLGDVRMCDLDSVRWSCFLREQSGWGATMRRLSQNAYRQAVQHCEAIGGIAACHHFGKIKGAGKRETREPRALQIDEVSALLDAAGTAAHRALYATMLGSGLRPGEAANLTWDCWDMDAGVLYPAGTKNQHASKAIPMTPLTRDEITPYWVALGKPTTGPCYLYRGKPIVKMYHGFRAVAERAGLGHVTPYDCRHTFATTLARHGVNRAAARRLMRHSSVSVILERAYEHMDVADVAKVVEGLPVAAK